MGPQVGKGGVSGNSPGWATCVIQVDGAYVCRLGGGRAQQRNSGICQHFCPWRELPWPPAFAPKLVSSFFCMSPVLFCASALVLELKVSKSLLRPFKTCSASVSQPVVFLGQYSAAFHSHMLLRGCLPGTGDLAWNPHLHLPTSQGGPLLPRYPSWFLITTLWVWDLPVLHLCLSYQSWCDFFIALVIKILFS